ncbi:GNAT family N-acetyltransferase [Enterococcus faecalis]
MDIRFYCKTLENEDLMEFEENIFTESEIDSFLFKDAVCINESEGHTTTGVFVENSKKLVGFFTLHVDIRLIDFKTKEDVTDKIEYIQEKQIDYDIVKILTVDYLGVRSDMQRQKIGTYILEKINRIAKRTSIKFILLHSLSQSKKFYEKNSFIYSDSITYHDKGITKQAIEMIKRV